MRSTSNSGSDEDHAGAPAVVNGSWFAAGSARRHDGTLTLEGGAFRVLSADGATAACPVAQARLSDFGDAMTVEFPDGSAFVVASGQPAAARLRAGVRGRAQLVTRLERRWQAVLVAVVATVVLCALLLFVVLPAMTAPLARLVPDAWARLIDEQSLPLFDRLVLDPSALPTGERERIAGGFAELVDGLGLDTSRYSLQFRSGGSVGANAFAMPGGTIIVTDRMTEIASPAELDAVLAHEIGHVELRHGLQQILRKSTLAIILVLVGPDAGTISELAQGLPAVLLDSGYSRAFEREADRFACDALARLGRDPSALADALQRLAEEHPEAVAVHAWVSSHPETDERIATIRSFTPAEPAPGR
ncbi:MAG: M48 family metallopeptidase [bacterium]|nr:M48 family metallopeptidase [bacterium]